MMSTANNVPLASRHPHPKPLASHAPALADMNGTPSSRPATSAAPNAPSHADMEEQTTIARPASTQSARPDLLRARSDFGPRHSSLTPEAAEDGSIDGHFKIRHGWDDQLNSEEYSNLLTSVR